MRKWLHFSNNNEQISFKIINNDKQIKIHRDFSRASSHELILRIHFRISMSIFKQLFNAIQVAGRLFLDLGNSSIYTYDQTADEYFFFITFYAIEKSGK